MSRKWIAIVVLCGVAGGTLSAGGSDIRVYYSAMKKQLKKQLFKEEGRYYLQGDSDERCKYAYLEDPDVSASGNRLVVEAKFSGRFAELFAGECIGPGVAFEVSVSGVPYYRDGILGLEDLRVGEVGSVFGGLVRNVLQNQLPRSVQLEVKRELLRAIQKAQTDVGLSLTLGDFQVSRPQVFKDYLSMFVHLELSVK